LVGFDGNTLLPACLPHFLPHFSAPAHLFAHASSHHTRIFATPLRGTSCTPPCTPRAHACHRTVTLPAAWRALSQLSKPAHLRRPAAHGNAGVLAARAAGTYQFLSCRLIFNSKHALSSTRDVGRSRDARKNGISLRGTPTSDIAYLLRAALLSRLACATLHQKRAGMPRLMPPPSPLHVPFYAARQPRHTPASVCGAAPTTPAPRLSLPLQQNNLGRRAAAYDIFRSVVNLIPRGRGAHRIHLYLACMREISAPALCRHCCTSHLSSLTSVAPPGARGMPLSTKTSPIYMPALFCPCSACPSRPASL